jgi:hypothetical protein
VDTGNVSDLAFDLVVFDINYHDLGAVRHEEAMGRRITDR